MIDQRRFWEAKIETWERSIYSRRRFSSRALLDSLAAPFRVLLRKRLEVAVELVKGHIRGKVVLDCGCGTGILLSRLAPYGPKKLIGVDIAAPAIEAARAVAGRHPGVAMEFLRADVREDASPLREADLVTAIGFIDYFSPAELARFTAAVGERLFLYSFPERRLSPRELLHKVYLRLAHCPGAYKYSRAEMDAILRRAGARDWWYYDRENIRYVTNLPR